MSRRQRWFSLGCLVVVLLGTAAPGFGQVPGPPPTTTTTPPLRPPDPPLPEPIFIRDLVSDLVVTELGAGLEVSPLTVESPAPDPGFDLQRLRDFAMPALVPLVLALLVAAAARRPRRIRASS